MTAGHKRIKNAFIDWVVPVLQAKGFQGGFPNYRRYTDRQIDILSLQFSMFDQAFCIGIAKCPYDGITFSNGDRLPGELVTANHCSRRFMLGTREGNLAHWFKYNPSLHELGGQHRFSSLTMYKDSLMKYKRIANDIVELLEVQAEPWWRNSEEWWLHEVPVYNRLFFDIQKGIFTKL